MGSLSDFLRYGPDNMLKRDRIPSEAALPSEAQEILDRIRAHIHPETGLPIDDSERGHLLETTLQRMTE